MVIFHSYAKLPEGNWGYNLYFPTPDFRIAQCLQSIFCSRCCFGLGERLQATSALSRTGGSEFSRPWRMEFASCIGIPSGNLK